MIYTFGSNIAQMKKFLKMKEPIQTRRVKKVFSLKPQNINRLIKKIFLQFFIEILEEHWVNN